jgi:hypothetical protein
MVSRLAREFAVCCDVSVLKNNEQGTRNIEQGTGNNEQGTRNFEQGTRNIEQGTRNFEHGRKFQVPSYNLHIYFEVQYSLFLVQYSIFLVPCSIFNCLYLARWSSQTPQYSSRLPIKTLQCVFGKDCLDKRRNPTLHRNH